jgi:hypothetical protein
LRERRRKMSMDGGDFDGNLQEKKKFGAVKV